MVRSRSIQRRSAASLLAALVLAAGVPLAVGAQTQPPAADDPFPFIGEVKLRDADGNEIGSPGDVVADRDLRLLAVGSGDLYYLLDLDRLVQVGVIDGEGVSAGSPTVLDGQNHRVFSGRSAASLRAVPSISMFSLTRSFDPVSIPFPDQYQGQIIGAMGYHQPSERLYAVTQLRPVSPQADAAPTLHAFDASTDSPSLLWSYPISGCQRLIIGSPGNPFLGISTSGDAAYFACKGFEFATVKFAPSAVVVVNMGEGQGSDTTQFTSEFYPFSSNLEFAMTFGDQAGQRLVVVPSGGSTNRMFVFDFSHRAWVGSVPMSDSNVIGAIADPATGRLYGVEQEEVLVTDGAQVPVPQGQRYPLGVRQGANFGKPGFDPVRKRLFVRGSLFTKPDGTPANSTLRVYEDRSPRPPEPPEVDPDDETHQVEEVPGRTPVTFSGGAAAYGVREIRVGGQRAITANPSHLGTEENFHAWVKRTAVDASGAVSSAIRSAPDRESEEGSLGSVESVCKDFSGNPQTDSNPGSLVRCDLEDLTAIGRARVSESSEPDESPVTVASSYSTTDVRRDPDRGVVAKATAVARGVNILGAVHIGEVRVDAETVAKGRTGTANSTFETTIKEFVGGGQYCGFGNETCDPNDVAEAINRALGPRVEARVPPRDLSPDVAGSDGGAQAVVIRDPYYALSELNMHNDGNKEVPGLHLVFYNDLRSEASRLVVHLAAVFAESHYAIGLPFEEPPPSKSSLAIGLVDDSNPPEPLAGGVFELYADIDEDLAIGLADELMGGGPCITAEDGVGDCVFPSIDPGPYVVRQKLAPAGYVGAPDFPFTLPPASEGAVVFVNLKAIGNVLVTLTDDSDPPKPLSGGTFELYADDGNQTLGSGDEKVDSCTTDAEGVCAFPGVPLGPYVLHQSEAPDEYLPADDIAFSLANPGDTAAVNVINGLEGIEAVPGDPGSAGTAPTRPAPAVPVAGDGSVAESFIEEIIPPAPAQTRVVVQPAPAPPPQAVLTTEPIAEAPPRLLPTFIPTPSQALAFVKRNAMQAVLFALVWILLGTPAWLARRRRLGQLVARTTAFGD